MSVVCCLWSVVQVSSQPLYRASKTTDSFSDERGEDFIREQHTGGREPQPVVIQLYQACFREAPQVCVVMRAHVRAEACAVCAEVNAAHQAQTREEGFGAGVLLIECDGFDCGARARFDKRDIARGVAF